MLLMEERLDELNKKLYQLHSSLKHLGDVKALTDEYETQKLVFERENDDLRMKIQSIE